MTLVIYIALFVLSLAWLFKKCQKPANFPPGPPKLPIIGSMPFLDGKSSLHVSKRLSEKYGKIWGAFLGSMPIVKITDYELAKDLMSREEFSGRPTETVPGRRLAPGYGHPNLEKGSLPGIVMSQGRHWQEQRRFALRHLRDMGFGKATMEESILEDVDTLCKSLEEQKDGPVSLNLAFNASIVNALLKLLFGEKKDLDDPDLKSVISNISDIFDAPMFSSPVVALLPNPDMISWPIIKDICQYDVYKRSFESLKSLVRGHLKSHDDVMEDERDEKGDFMSVYLKQIKEEKDPRSSLFGSFGRDSMVNTIIDLIVAGSETTSTSLVWTLHYLVHHTDIQDRIHAELDSVVGPSRTPQLSDRDSLPLVNAVLQESLRLTSLAVDAVPHAVREEVTVHGYTFPKGCIVMPGLYEIMHDPAYYKDPDTFNPDRFIDPDTGKFIRDDRVIPFGIGKRVCPGQSLAEKEFFLFFVGIMQRFKFRAYPGVTLKGYSIDDVLATPTGRMAPKGFKVQITER